MIILQHNYCLVNIPRRKLSFLGNKNICSQFPKKLGSEGNRDTLCEHPMTKPLRSGQCENSDQLALGNTETP